MPRFAAEAGEVTGEGIVESGKVTPNDVRVERAHDRFLRLAIEEEPHHGLDATRGLGAELLPALGFVGVDRDPVPAFAAWVMDDHVKSEPTATPWGNSDRRLAHRLLSMTLVQTSAQHAEIESGRQALGCSDEILQKKQRLRHACCPRVHKDQRWLRVVYVSKFGSRVEAISCPYSGTNSTVARFSLRDPGKRWRPNAPPRRDHVVAPKPS